MGDAVAAVSAFEGHGEIALAVAVKLYAEFAQFEHVGRPFGDKHLQRGQIVLVAARDEGVGNVKLVIVIVLVDDRRDASPTLQAVLW